jgi:hypothetical protein
MTVCLSRINRLCGAQGESTAKPIDIEASMSVQPPLTDHPADLTSAPAPRKRQSLSGVYVAAWGTLAAFATGYLAFLLVQPEWARSMTAAQPSQRDEATEQNARATLRIATEVDSLRRTVADLKRELAYVKTAANARPEQDVTHPITPQAATQPVAAPDSVPQPRLVAAQREETPPPAAKAGSKPELVVLNANTAEETHQAPAEPVRKPVRTVAIAKTPETAPNETGSTPKAVRYSSMLETGSLPPVPQQQQQQIAFGPATVTPSASPVAIILDSGPSLDALRLRWNILHDRHQSALMNLQPRYVTGGTRGAPSYQLLAGPVASPDEAIRICALLNARNVGCSVGQQFVGNAL